MIGWIRGMFPWGSRRNRLSEESATPISNESYTDNGGVGTESALRLSVIWACINLRAQIFGSLPIHLRDSDGKMLKDNSVYRLLHRRPNATQTSYTFRTVLSRHVDLYGNAFVRIGRDGNGKPLSLDIIDPEKVELERTKYAIKYYVDKVEARASDIIHVMGMSLDGMLGLSPIVYMADTISTSNAVNKASQTEFKNGLKAGGFVYTGEVTLQPEQRARMRNVLSEFSKPENAGKWMLMEAGMKPEVIGDQKTSPADAQLLEHRKQLVIEICSVFGVNPSMIGYSFAGNTWGGTLEQQNLQFLQYQMNPLLVNVEQELEAKLLSLTEQSRISIKHSVEGLLRADSKTRADMMATQSNNGLRTLNEVRALDDMPPIEGGDIAVRQVQYQPLGTPLSSNQAGAPTDGTTTEEK